MTGFGHVGCADNTGAAVPGVDLLTETCGGEPGAEAGAYGGRMKWGVGDRILFDRDGETGRVWSVQSIDTRHGMYLLSGPSVIVPLGLFIAEVDDSGWWRGATDDECDAQLVADRDTNTQRGWAVTQW